MYRFAMTMKQFDGGSRGLYLSRKSSMKTKHVNNAATGFFFNNACMVHYLAQHPFPGKLQRILNQSGIIILYLVCPVPGRL